MEKIGKCWSLGVFYGGGDEDREYIPFLARSEREEKEFAFLVMYKTSRYIEAIAKPPSRSHSF